MSKSHPFNLPPPGTNTLPTGEEAKARMRRFWANGVGPRNEGEMWVMLRSVLAVSEFLPLGLDDITGKAHGDLVILDTNTAVVTIWRPSRWTATCKLVMGYPVDVRMALCVVKN